MQKVSILCPPRVDWARKDRALFTTRLTKPPATFNHEPRAEQKHDETKRHEH